MPSRCAAEFESRTFRISESISRSLLMRAPVAKWNAVTGISLSAKTVKYDFAQTQIVAASTDGIYRTTLVSRIEGLMIGGRLEVDEITCRLQSPMTAAAIRDVGVAAHSAGR
ncbi:MAG: hypothetical protein WDO73_12725 [Ignavibacteriota bacterium]